MRAHAIPAALLLLLIAATPVFAGGEPEPLPERIFNVAVLAPGPMATCPCFELAVAGATRAVQERVGENDDAPAATITVVEAAASDLLEEILTSLAGENRYHLIVTASATAANVAATIAADFPNQRFLVLNSHLADNQAIHTLLFNHREQAFLAGAFAGLVAAATTNTEMPPQVGFIAPEDNPLVATIILPAFELGLRTVEPEATTNVRIVPTTASGVPAAALQSIYAAGAPVALSALGRPDDALTAVARERERTLITYGVDATTSAPDAVLGGTYVGADRAVYERTLAAIDGTLVYGEAEVLGVADGYVGIALDDRNVDAEIRDAMQAIVERMEEGRFWLEMPLGE